MSLINLLKKNAILALFFLTAALYTYGLSNNIDFIIYFIKPLIVPSLLIHYMLTVKNKNKNFITALVFSFLGDVLFNIQSDLSFFAALGSFLLFNLFIIMILSEKIGEIKLSKFFVIMLPFSLVLVAIIFVLLANTGIMQWVFFINALVILVMTTLSVYAYIKTKDKTSLYFMIGTLFFIVTATSKVFKEFAYGNMQSTITNTISYSLTLYFYYRAMTFYKIEDKVKTKQITKQSKDFLHIL